jgi:cytochrome oxidase Cu insertion factor (SCO1/SenC/PrrC family)
MLGSSPVQRFLLVLLLALVVALGVALVQRPQSPGVAAPQSPFDGPTLPAGLRAANFSLTDQYGHQVTLARYRGHVIALTFIHSLCHEACPLMVQDIRGALSDLPGNGAGVVTLGVSVAPAEDTRANRRKFLAKQGMTGRMSFLNGPPSYLKRVVWKEYHIAPEVGTVDNHSAYVFLIDRWGRERVGFPVDQATPERIAHDIRVLLKT